MIKRLPAALLTAALMVAAAVPTVASAHDWNRDHPARAEINQRIDRQNHRIADARRDGDISGREARAFRAREHDIRMQERFAASRHDGHLTRGEARHFNHELNRTNRELGR